MSWSPQQEGAIAAVRGWLADKMGAQVFRLFGYAGTGKTTLAEELSRAHLAHAECGEGVVRHDSDMLGGWEDEAEQAGLGGRRIVANSDSSGQPRRAERNIWAEAGFKTPQRDDAVRLGSSRAVGDWWATEPNVGRVANGVPHRMDRLRCLGNAVVPQIPELIGRAILATLDRPASLRDVA